MNSFPCNHSLESKTIKVGNQHFRFPQILQNGDKCICKYCNRDITNLYNSISTAYRKAVVEDSLMQNFYNYSKILKSQKAINKINGVN